MQIIRPKRIKTHSAMEPSNPVVQVYLLPKVPLIRDLFYRVKIAEISKTK